MTRRARKRRHARPMLLILLWIWAICVFTIVDMFFNVAEFDRVRPRARLYRAMRYSGHRLVGEPYLDGDFGDSRQPQPGVGREGKAEQLRRALAAVHGFEREGMLEGLRGMAFEHGDARVRIEALAAMVRQFGRQSRETLLKVARDRRETDKVRFQAARLLGRTGRDALPDLERLLGTDQREAVRHGAVRGLGEVGSPAAAERLLSLADDPRLRSAAVRAVAIITAIEALPVLASLVTNTERSPGIRAAACRALTSFRVSTAVDRLMEVLEGGAPAEVRAAAAWGLGVLAERRAINALKAARYDASPAVARAARRSLTRVRSS